MKKLIISLAILFAGLFLFTECAYCSGYQTTEKELYSSVVYDNVIFKHNALGYWQIEANSGNATIYDRYIDYENQDAHCYGYFLSVIQLPQDIISARKEGKDVKVKISSCGLPSAVDFDDIKYVFTSLSTLQIVMGLKPAITKYNLGDFISGFNSFTPLIDYRYGYNQYMVYPAIGNPVPVQGFFNWLYPTHKDGNYLHHSYIKNKRGQFKSGTTVNIYGESKSTTLYTIGRNGSFLDGSAVNLVYYCPYKITYTVTETVWVSDPDVPVIPDPPSKEDDDSEEKEDPKKDWLLRVHRII